MGIHSLEDLEREYLSLKVDLEDALVKNASFEDVNFTHRSLCGLSNWAYRFPDFFDNSRMTDIGSLLLSGYEYLRNSRYDPIAVCRRNDFEESVFLMLQARKALDTLVGSAECF